MNLCFHLCMYMPHESVKQYNYNHSPYNRGYELKK